MECSWRDEQLALHDILSLFPHEVHQILKSGSNQQYLNVLAELALRSGLTEAIHTRFEPIFVEICSRWMRALGKDCSPLSVVKALARVLPAAPHLSLYVEEIACQQKAGEFKILFSSNVTALLSLGEHELVPLLGTLFRLLQFDESTFACLIPLSQIRLLMDHASPCVKILAIRVLCLFLRASDSVLEQMIHHQLGEMEVHGNWDGTQIDYRFLTMWEEKRINSLMNHQKGSTEQPSAQPSVNGKIGSRSLCEDDLMDTTAHFGGVLVPSLSFNAEQTFISTPTSQLNLKSVAQALKETRPVLVTGPAGSGKTTIVRHLAQGLSCLPSMVTLHLNDQTDAKSLVGMHTSAAEPGSFKWQPGVLTTAVLEGRWVLVEDLDRAPAEVLGTILPLLDRNELLVPHLGGWQRAAPGFRLISTMRTSPNSRGEEIEPPSSMVGLRHWSKVKLHGYEDSDLLHMIQVEHPILSAYESGIMALYRALRSYETNHTESIGRSNAPGPQKLLQFCSRLRSILTAAGIKGTHEPVSVTVQDSMFLEAVDCFSASSRSLTTRTNISTVIAQTMSFPPERAQFCLHTRIPSLKNETNCLDVGRISLPVKATMKGVKQRSESRPFAITNHTLRYMESIASAVKACEPCLLVGETGTGKTTVVQELANLLGHQLTVVNLSQQSEASDLLGGFKPNSARSMALPIQEDFQGLFEQTVSSSSNEKFMKSLEKAISKEDWSRAVALWREAVVKVRTIFKSSESDQPNPKKRRKIDTPKYKKLASWWEELSSRVEAFSQSYSHNDGGKGFAFHFVEGNIVRAVKSGAWVLLDEINLASPDTLEALADLFVTGKDTRPSLLLTEAGDVQKIEAHSDFRIFGAMNPATDVGKRDLPPSIRNRFTELYVDSPDGDQESLEQIVQAYLGSYCHGDVRISKDVTDLYRAIKSLENENKLVDGSEQKPHFSLRTLTRTLTYARDIAPLYGMRRALFEGFSMSFLTFLNSESSKTVQAHIDKHLLGKHSDIRSLLEKPPKRPQDNDKYIAFGHYWIRQGAFPVEDQPHYIITPFVKSNLMNLVRATSTRRYPVLLQGPTSSGKTSMVEHLAKISGNRFVRINNHEHTDLQEYLGTYVSTPDGLRYQEGVLVRALREGYWIVLDELNLAPTDVLEALNRLLDDNRELLIPETQEIIRPHRDFMLFATQNPPGLYGGRKVLSRALRNRFLELHFDDIPENELQTILVQRTQIAPAFGQKIVDVYRKLAILRQANRMFEHKNSFATLRDLFRWALRDAATKEDLAVDGFMLLGERVRNPEERTAVKQVIEEVMKTTIDVDQLYSRSAFDAIDGTRSALVNDDIVWTASARRLFLLIEKALRNNEPVLLVGGTGIGKTSICQVIAESKESELHILNAHQNTETGDLIGAQRPIRNRAKIESELVVNLRRVFESLEPVEINQPLDSLIKRFESLSTEVLAELPKDLVLNIQIGISRSKTLFEWSDGALVRAMKGGAHFLLDEISLADDSVLERLNSVLEPERRLLLAEKGLEGALVEATGGFQFLATMNPGGDYGKKELSPALRNRFTEIWVPNVTNEDVEGILRAKLGASLQPYASQMVSFASWYGQTFRNGPSVSLREVLAWATFINAVPSTDHYFAILHGAAMVYIDAIGANPSAARAIAEDSIVRLRQQCLTRLSEIFGHDIMNFYENNADISISHQDLKAGQFSFKRQRAAHDTNDFSFTAETTRRNALRVLRAMQLDKPILLEGSPGVGKTTLVAAISSILGNPLTRINLSDQTDVMDLFGSDVPTEDGEAGQFAWRDAPFLQAMQRGEWVLLDEMNLASQSVLEGLNACLDHRGQAYIPELDQTFTKHPEFRLFAAQNPHSQGGGRKGLPASFVNRFTVVYAELLQEQDMEAICSRLHPDFESQAISKMVKSVTGLSDISSSRGPRTIKGGPWEFNLRDVLRWIHLLDTKGTLLSGLQFADLWDLLFLHRLRDPKDVHVAKEEMMSASAHPLPERTYFRNLSYKWYQSGYGILPVDRVSRSHIRPVSWKDAQILESLMLSVQQGWPSLLVGVSGSGKTRLIHHLASVVGEELMELPLNADSDTMDILGGYEQVDNTRKLRNLAQRLYDETRRTFLKNVTLDCSYSDLQALFHALGCLNNDQDAELLSIKEMLDHVKGKMQADLFDNFSEEYNRLQSATQINERARFEWIDGALVRAVEQGKWIVLDNANLCGPSVLDRLNSLLEPKGLLVINENRNADGSVRTIKPHPNFRLFLTVDPRYGEVSRAMRNRCIELHLTPDEHAAQKVQLIGGNSFWYRAEALQRIDWQTIQPNIRRHLAQVAFEALSLGEHRHLESLSQALLSGLISTDTVTSLTIYDLASSFKSTWDLSSPILETTAQVIRDLAERAGFLDDEFTDFIGSQPIHPLVNGPLVSLVREDTQAEMKITWYSTLFDMVVGLKVLESSLVRIAAEAREKQPQHLTRLERSMLSARQLSFSKDSTQPLESFFASMLQNLNGLLNHQTDIVASVQSQNILKEIRFFTSHLVEISHSTNFTEPVFQADLTIGRRLAAKCTTDTSISAFGRALDTGLALFNEGWSLSTGTEIETLWRLLKPEVATDMKQLRLITDVESLADGFDSLAFYSQVPVSILSGLRSSLIEGYETMNKVQGDQVIAHIKQAIQDEKLSQSSSARPRQPHLLDEFEGIRQILSINSKTIGQDNQINMLAGRPTRQSLRYKITTSSSKILFSLEEQTGIGNQKTELIAVRQLLPLSVIQKMTSIPNTTLGSIGTVREELDTLCSIFSKSTEAIGREIVENLRAVLLDLHQGLEPALLGSQTEGSGLTNGQVQQVALTYLQPALGLAESSRTSLLTMGSAYVSYFVGLLLLYVPDKAYDPALVAVVTSRNWTKRVQDLRDKATALQIYERETTGCSSNLRHAMITAEIRDMGSEPEYPQIARPDSSRLSHLQGEFSSVLTSILPRCPSASDVHTLKHTSSLSADWILIRENIARIQQRLCSQYREYDDIVQPVVAMLQGLDIGLALMIVDTESPHLKEGNLPTTELGSHNTSLLGLGLSEVRMAERHAGGNRLEDSAAELKIWMAEANVQQHYGLPVSQSVHSQFEWLLSQWQSQLADDREKHVAKSSLYRYRGSQADAEEVDQEEFDQLFPDFDQSEQGLQENQSTDTKYLTELAADLQARMFKSTISMDTVIIDLAEQISHQLAKTCNPGRYGLSPVPADGLLSMAIHQLHKAHTNLQHKGTSSTGYNFYQDPNLGEVDKLLPLVQRVQTRFAELKAAWPEHATLDDVNKCCSEIMDFKHTDPLAKILTKIEKLHGFVYEWQTVASSEFSAAGLYTELTDLLVSWRRIELSTWGRLLDLEDEKCVEESKSWWFIAYEAIVGGTVALSDSQKSVEIHTEHLLQELKRFIESTSLGQFDARLELIDRFAEHVSTISSSDSVRKSVKEALRMFQRYYARFQPVVRETLKTKRDGLEKDLKEVVLLASWRDTNITALRESAKRSHHRLFKVVRKYRGVLAEPVDNIVQRPTAQAITETGTQKSMIPEETPAELFSHALDTCKKHVPGWEQLPTRFQDTMTLARIIRQESGAANESPDHASYLTSYATNFLDSVHSLQKETPSALSKDNAEVVKHLKTRKRKVFADTLKDLRRMGFKSNVDTETTKRQKDIPTVLAALESSDVLQQADSALFGVLDRLESIRVASRAHSEDLTAGEVARSVGTFESLLSATIKQRKILMSFAQEIQQLRQQSAIIRDLGIALSSGLHHGHSSDQTIQKHLHWLQGILGASSAILQKQADMGSLSLEAPITSLNSYADTVERLRADLSSLPKLPSGVVSGASIAWNSKLQEVMAELTNWLKESEHHYPAAKHVIKHIIPWVGSLANVQEPNGIAAKEDSSQLTEVCTQFQDLVDTVLVGIQTVKPLPKQICDPEEDGDWLLRSNAQVSRVLASMQLPTVTEKLGRLVETVKSVPGHDLATAAALCLTASPVISQYCNAFSSWLDRYMAFHTSLCRFGQTMAVSLLELLSSGFCSPQEKSNEQNAKEKLEEGTGLGEGDGAEDISKDIQDDEDISEMAQEANKEKKEMENEDDAVDMGADELEGDTGDAEEKTDGEDEEREEDEEGEDMDEEAGSVDDLDPSAVDEKMWDGKDDKKDAQEKEGENNAGTRQEEMTAQDGEGEENNDGPDEEEAGPEESEEVRQEDREKMDPHAQEEQNLDLPEDLNMDDENGSGKDSDDELGDDASDLSMADAAEEQDVVEADEEDSQGEIKPDGAQDADSEPDQDNDGEAEEREPEQVDVDDGKNGEDGLEDPDRDDQAPGDGHEPSTKDTKDGMDTEMSNDPNQPEPEQAKDDEQSTQAPGVTGQDGQEKNAAQESGTSEQKDQSNDAQPFKKLGDALEAWHRINNIQDTSQDTQEAPESRKDDPQEFEHLPDENTAADAQALGEATADEAHVLDQNQLVSEVKMNEEFPLEAPLQAPDQEMPNVEPQEQSRESQATANPSMIADKSQRPEDRTMVEEGQDASEERDDIEELHNDLSVVLLEDQESLARPADEAQRLWTQYESMTRDLALSLTEQLRLILEPTLASKMRGDFRTGKRLNIKRIIPYIASQYKRDKIWMRRSVPSKRSYQIMLALDDSKSMGESGCGRLAFETLALVSKSLSMLEVGQICILGFGADVQVAHGFDQPFSSEAGAQVFRHFGFKQTTTNVRRLIQRSLDIFREARARNANSRADLWQLQLIISDGVCEDHEDIRRLVRQAHEERVMIVFVIVDGLSGDSITKLEKVSWVAQADGKMALSRERYLDRFPFGYYLIVGDVQELPHVLSTALRQWFAEVVESG